MVACTNLVDYIDPAIRRRFQLKVELLPLNANQRLNLFKKSCQKLGLSAGDDSALHPRMSGWGQLAYGHFTNAVEIAENLNDLTLEGFAKLLEQEIASTNGSISRPIGFLQ